MGSRSQNGDPGKIHPIFYRGSSGRATPLYNIKKGKEDAKRRRGRLVLEFYIAFGAQRKQRQETGERGSRILWEGFASLRGRFLEL